MNKLLSICCFLLIVASACKKEKQASEIKTLNVQSPDPTRVIITGNISGGNIKITEYGFVYGYTPGVSKENGTVVSMGTSFKEGNFTKEIQNLKSEATPSIYVKAFLVDGNGIRYGEELSSERPVFEVGVVSPLYGKTEDLITIKGKFYNPQLNDISVTFSNVPGKIQSVSDTEIIAVVPKGIPEFHDQRIKVSVINKGLKTEMTDRFVILAHIHDYTPKEGGIGSEISFIADNLPKGPWAVADVPIYFGEVQATFFFVNEFQVYVPMDVPSEKMPVYVSIKGVKTKLPGEFTLLKPVIIDITPKTALPGTHYTIKGRNLPFVSYTPDQPIGKLGGKSVKMTLNNTVRQEIYFTSSVNTPAGEHPFTMEAGPFKVISEQKVTILPGQITGMSPVSGFVNTNVTLTGTFITPNSYDIYVNNKVIKDVWCSDEGKLSVWIGQDIPEGDVNIAVQMGDIRVPAGIFKLRYPKISSISPIAGKPGTKVILYAPDDSFYFSSSKPNVYFGDVKVTPSANVELGHRQISVIVPADAKPGKVKIRLDYADYQMISPEFFEVLP